MGWVLDSCPGQAWRCAALPGVPWGRVWEHPAPFSCSPSPATPSQLGLEVLLRQGEGCLQPELELRILLGSWKLKLSWWDHHSLVSTKSPTKACPPPLSSHR